MANPYRLLPPSHHHPLLLLPSSGTKAIRLCPQEGQTGRSCHLGSAGSGLPWKESSAERHQASSEAPPQAACSPLSQPGFKHLLTQLCAQSVHTVGLQFAHRIKEACEAEPALLRTLQPQGSSLHVTQGAVWIFRYGLPLRLSHTLLSMPSTCLPLLLQLQ